jgi:ATP-dependent protease Clp ATPase subunit
MFGRRQLACSFCHQPETTVAKLVAGPRLLFVGPRVYICNRCVATANEIMERAGGDEPA